MHRAIIVNDNNKRYYRILKMFFMCIMVADFEIGIYLRFDKNNENDILNLLFYNTMITLKKIY